MKKKLIYFIIAIIFLLQSLSVTTLALTPSYTVSAPYRGSIYYERLSSLKLTGDERRDIVNIAITQLGYHEGNSASDFDGMNFGGTGNYVEYNYANRNTYSNGGTYSYAWCASFVTWCARQAGISTSTVINSVSCDNFVSKFKSKSQYKTRASGYRPIAGDLIFFLDSGSNRTYASHVGIVIGTDSGYVYTIEGNTTRGFVNYRRYSLGSTYIVGYGVPSYTGTVGNYSDFKLLSGYVEPGIYTVNSSTGILNLRSGPSTSYSRITEIPTGTKLYISEASGDWGRVTYNGKSGWVSLDYVKPDKVTVKYDANGGDNAPQPTSVSGSSSCVLSSSIPSREGHLFIGWARHKDAKNAEYMPGESYRETSDITLYAVWERLSYTVEFLDYDGSVISRKDYFYGDEVEIPENPTKESDSEYEYSFFGWDKEIKNRVNEGVSYKAIYVAVPIIKETETDAPETETSPSVDTDAETFPETEFDIVTETLLDTETDDRIPGDTSSETSNAPESSCAETGVGGLIALFVLLTSTAGLTVLKRKK